MDRPGRQIQTGGRVNRLAEADQGRGMDAGIGVEGDFLKPFHHIAKDRSLGATTGANLFLELVFEIGFFTGPDHNHAEVIININGGDHVIITDHVLVAQEPDRHAIRPVPEGHGGDDFLAVEVDRHGAFDHHRHRYRLAGLINAVNSGGQPACIRVRHDFFHLFSHPFNVGRMLLNASLLLLA